MIDLKYIKNFYPTQITSNKNFDKHILKEYIELLALDYLSTTEYVEKLAFIGGTNLRLVKGLDRFSEDIDFDFKGLDHHEFMKMTDSVANKLAQNGLEVEIRDKDNSRLTAFRRNIYFPQLLFNLGLTGHREERFLLKVEAQDQGVGYERQTATIDRCGFHIVIPVPSDRVLLSMKLVALLARAKGRDFYDVMFLWQQTSPDFDFLKARAEITDMVALKDRLISKVHEVDLNDKVRDFQHLLFDASQARRILDFERFVSEKERRGERGE